MNDRERFKATMHYQPRDRAPITDFNFWDETLPAWHEQGLPPSVNRANSADFFGMDYSLGSGAANPMEVGVEMMLWPPFEEVVVEDRGDREVVQQADGVWVLCNKVAASIPMHVSHLLVDRDSWRKHYRPRLDPTIPSRYPENWDDLVKIWADPQRNHPVFLHGGSLYGRLRDWMGVENLSLVVYDDPAWFEEMVTTTADCIIGVLTHILETGGQFDGCGLWEDMAYNAGPLLSPKHFAQYLAPHYRRIADLLHRYGVDVIWVDCDGKIDRLVPLWLEAGINCMFPVEVGTWGADPIQFRREYGQDLLMMGGFSKHILAGSKKEIQQEVCRLAPLVEEGGYIGFPDHRVPPTVPLKNYMFYLETVREVWGHQIDLKPMERLVQPPGQVGLQF
jgi:uroporphyrinogen decarboxylase